MKKLVVAPGDGQPEKSTKKANRQGGGTHWLGAVFKLRATGLEPAL